MTIELNSNTFAPGEPIPPPYTRDGENLSPPLQWMQVPEEVRSFVLLVEDPDAPAKVWSHWVVYNIPPEARELPEGVMRLDELPDGIRQGRNDFHKIGYDGPEPPHGETHRYFFRIYALDRMLELPPGADRGELRQAIEGHVLDEGELMGTYERPE